MMLKEGLAAVDLVLEVNLSALNSASAHRANRGGKNGIVTIMCM
jgi:hypothetical protein